MRSGSFPITVGIAAIALALGGPLLAQLEWVSPLAALVVFAAGGLVGLVAVIWGGLDFGVKRRVRGLVGACLGLIPAVLVGVPLLIAADHPRINDITSDLDDPPVFRQAPTLADNAGADFTYPPEFVPIARAAYGNLVGLRVELAPARAFDAAAAVLDESGWQLTRRDEERLELEAVVATPLFRFRDDVVIRVRGAAGSEVAAIVDVRSRSRLGSGDLGKNAARIRAFFDKLSARLQLPRPR